MLIASVFSSVMQMKPRYGAVSYKGHVVNLAHNLPKIVDVLPNTPADLPIFLES